MAGGIGSRFWPMSSESVPKQFLDVLGTGKSLLQMTLEEVRKPSDSVEADLERAQINYDLATAQLEVYRKRFMEEGLSGLLN